jgi:hypothetical protein
MLPSGTLPPLACNFISSLHISLGVLKVAAVTATDLAFNFHIAFLGTTGSMRFAPPSHFNWTTIHFPFSGGFNSGQMRVVEIWPGSRQYERSI